VIQEEKHRVALVALHFAEYAVSLALALADRWEVLLVLYRDHADAQLGVGWSNRISHPCLKLMIMERPNSVVSILQNESRLVKKIRCFNPNVIHYQEDPRDELVLGLPFLRHTPTVLTVHDPVTHLGADSERVRYSRFRLYLPLLRRTANAAITHGSSLAEDLVRRCSYLRGKVQTVPHGPLGFHDGRAGARPHNFRLLFFGRIHKYKGLRYFVESVIALRDKGYPVIGVVAGRGSDLSYYKSRMHDAGCFEILDRYIPNEEISDLFLSSYIVILPYIEGTQSGVAAMALGFARPVVATAVGSIPELVRNRENGLLVPPFDTVALTEAIEMLLTNSQLWEVLAAGAQKMRDGELSWPAIADKTICIYKAVIAKSRSA
jgi:glycosyltransferase involved in cell wall biosynthesis